jgi:hypothetical protein
MCRELEWAPKACNGNALPFHLYISRVTSQMRFGSRNLVGNLGESHPLIKQFHSISGLVMFNLQVAHSFR